MGKKSQWPVIGVVMGHYHVNGHASQAVQEKYLEAILAAGGLPIALPRLLVNQRHGLDNVLSRLDGVFLTGSPSSLGASHDSGANQSAHPAPGQHALALALIVCTLELNLPLFAVGRGMKELVVAMGGTLHSELLPQDGFLNHREDESLTLEQQYAAAHPVTVKPGGLLAQLLPADKQFEVNSLHIQGTRWPGPFLRVEARAPDKLIEAVSVRDYPFALGVQWNPEWHSEENPISQRLFEGFICACHSKRANILLDQAS